jgi:uncharacterized protein YkwD
MVRGHSAAAVVMSAFAAALLFGGYAHAPHPLLADDAYAVFAIPAPSTAVRASAPLEDAVLAWLNRERASRGLPLLRDNAAMRGVARAYGREMFMHGYLSHVSKGGRTLQDRLIATGLHFGIVGENLAYAPDVSEAEQALWNSQPHRRNMLYPGFQLVGVAVIDGGDGVIVVQDFADTPEEEPMAGRLPPARPAR